MLWWERLIDDCVVITQGI